MVQSVWLHIYGHDSTQTPHTSPSRASYGVSIRSNNIFHEMDRYRRGILFGVFMWSDFNRFIGVIYPYFQVASLAVGKVGP